MVLPLCEAVSDLAEAGGFAQEIHEIHEVMTGHGSKPWYPDGHRLVNGHLFAQSYGFS